MARPDVFSDLGALLVDNLVSYRASPIEHQYLAGLVTECLERAEWSMPMTIHGHVARMGSFTSAMKASGIGADTLCGSIFAEVDWYVTSQATIGTYVADFAFVTEWGKKVVVECDGHDFHERTKEQAAHDRSRDRFMASNGWLVLRYTGSEIFRDQRACAVDTMSHLARLGREEESEIARSRDTIALRHAARVEP